MGIAPGQFRQYILRPVLGVLSNVGEIPYSLFAENLLMATAAQETHVGDYIVQLNGGPGIGLFQIERASFYDIYDHTLFKLKNADRILAYIQPTLPTIPHEAVIYNLRFAAMIARIFYWRFPEPLPIDTTLDNLWHYYKTYWNTKEGAATIDQFRTNLLYHTDLSHLVQV